MKDSPYVSTTNACKLCTPLGATLAFKGVEGCVPFLHGSQGCATYMRRYVISHYREPVDIASSALGEKNAVYGGGPNLKKGLLNVMRKYEPQVIGVATTCLTETIGDDVPMILKEFRAEFGDLDLPDVVQVSTPSYSGTHMDGFHGAVRALVEQLAVEPAPASRTVNVMPGFVSAADLRHLRALVRAFGVEPVLLPDYADTLDGPALEDYQTIPSGGTPVAAIRTMGGALGSIECGRVLAGAKTTAGTALAQRFGVPLARVGLPIGLRETDAFMAALEAATGTPMPRELELERGRLVDAYVDGHKYVFGKRAVVYGEEDLVIGLTALLAEMGVRPVLCATGARGEGFGRAIAEVCEGLMPELPQVRTGADFWEIEGDARALAPDLLVGHSKGYRASGRLDAPLVRVGFPIHDRFGGQRLRHLGYGGTQELFDRIVNTVIERKQSTSDIGYGYI